MAYQALYRKWRPLTFDDVVGQEHITRTLKNEVESGKLAHAYLFCGTRGTGKTSTAKILARAVNCLNPQNGNPCNECEVCRGILDESIVDVAELDGASRNKVENIRDIIDDVMFLPAVAKKKVYIIDEVHMVTQSAFNALLKTLEEPPEHVLFILATTELNKVPATVLSRCQRFDFRRITNADIVARLKTILAGDGRRATDESLALIAELGDGSMRDSLSILDQCLGFGDQELTYDDVVNIVGITDDAVLFRLTEAVAKNDGGAALQLIDEVSLAGKELGVFLERFIGFLRGMLIVKLVKRPEKILNISAERLSRMQKLAPELTKEKLIHALGLLNESVAAARQSAFSRTVYELALVKLCDPTTEDTCDALADRVAQLEKKIAEGSVVLPTGGTQEKPNDDGPAARREESAEMPPWEELPPVPEEAPPVEGTDIAPEPMAERAQEPAEGKIRAAARWDEVISQVKLNGGMPIFSHLKKAKVRSMGEKLGLIFDEKSMMSKSVMSKPANLELVQRAIRTVTGEDVAVECYSRKEAGEEKEEDDALSKLEELSKKHGVIEFL